MSTDKKTEKKTYMLASKIETAAGLPVPVILATWEAKIGRIANSGQPRQIDHKTSSPK
jgi:hypothetical protein